MYLVAVVVRWFLMLSGLVAWVVGLWALKVGSEAGERCDLCGKPLPKM